jgi:ribosomal protein S18 acetylase RimI-like enzyme
MKFKNGFKTILKINHMANSLTSNDLLIRDYRSSDYPEIAKLWVATDMDNPVRGDNRETIERTLKLGGKFLILESVSARQIIGTSWMTYDGRRIMIHHFGILPEFQGKKYSKILMKESLKFCKEIGVQVKLEVHSQNINAVSLYTKFGFKQLPGYNIYIIRDISKLLS